MVSGIQRSRKAGWGAVAVVLLVSALSPQAAAGQTLPPADSELDQYVPTLPGPEGNHPLGGAGGGNGGDAGGGSGITIPNAALEDLRGLGSEGEAAAAGLAQTAEVDGKGQPGGRGSERSVGGGDSSPRSPLGAVMDSLGRGTGEGMGIVFPLIVAGALGLAIAYAMANHRRQAPGGLGRER